MTRLIKKYKNRRLYDTETSRYITFEELTEYVLAGIIFRVIDASAKDASEEDITNATLLQIFVEMEASKTHFFSEELLRQMIILAHHPMNKMFKTMFEQFVTSMNQTTQHQSDPFQSSHAGWGTQMQDLVRQWQGLFKNF